MASQPLNFRNTYVARGINYLQGCVLHHLRLASFRVSQVTFTLPILWIFFTSGRCLPETVRDGHFQAILIWTCNSVTYEVYGMKAARTEQGEIVVIGIF